MESAQRDTVWFGGGGKREKKKPPTETFSLKTRIPKSLFKKTDYLFRFLLVCVYTLYVGIGVFFWVPFPSQPSFVENLLQPPPPLPRLSMKGYPPPGSCSTWRTQITQNSRQFWNVSFLLLSLCSYFPGVSQFLLISFELNIDLDWKLRTCWYCTCTTLPSCFRVLARLWLRIGSMIGFLFFTNLMHLFFQATQSINFLIFFMNTAKSPPPFFFLFLPFWVSFEFVFWLSK